MTLSEEYMKQKQLLQTTINKGLLYLLAATSLELIHIDRQLYIIAVEHNSINNKEEILF